MGRVIFESSTGAQVGHIQQLIPPHSLKVFLLPFLLLGPGVSDPESLCNKTIPRVQIEVG